MLILFQANKVIKTKSSYNNIKQSIHNKVFKT